MKRYQQALASAAACIGISASAATVEWGTAASFAVLGASTVTSTGPTVIDGNLGVSPGGAITGFPPGVVQNGTIHANDAVAVQAQSDAFSAYLAIAGMEFTHDLTGQDLGGITLTPGVYKFDSSAQLTGLLTLDGQGQSNPLFVFQIGSTFTTASDSAILGIDGAGAGNIVFQVGTSATLGTGTSFVGSIVALASNTLNTGASVEGRIIALQGGVTLDSNSIVLPVPEPATAGLLGLGAMMLLMRLRKRMTAVT